MLRSLLSGVAATVTVQLIRLHVGLRSVEATPVAWTIRQKLRCYYASSEASSRWRSELQLSL